MNSHVSSNSKLFVKHTVLLTIALSLAGLCSSNAISQKTQTTEEKADGSLKSSSRVNPSTLAMEFNLPLGNYPGRGGNSMPLFLNYSSKLWEAKMYGFRYVKDPTGDPLVPYQVLESTDILLMFSKRSISGWTSSLHPPLIKGNLQVFNQSGQLYAYHNVPPFTGNELTGGGRIVGVGDTVLTSACASGVGRITALYNVCEGNDCHLTADVECIAFPDGGGDGPGDGGDPPHQPSPIPTPVPQHPYVVPRISILMPDGSGKEFRREDRAIPCSLTDHSCSEVTGSGTYLTVDGSGDRLEINEVQADNGTKDILYTSNGGRYIFPSSSSTTVIGINRSAEKYIDPNGNTTYFNASSRTLTDTMGRELPDLLKDPYGLDDQEAEIQPIHLKGINNQDLSYSIVWKKLEDSFENSTTQLKYVGQDTCISVGMHPVNGSSLFKNADEYVHIETPDDSSIRYVENQRACNGAIQGSAHFNPVVMAEFIQPNGQKYTFKYNEYGEITRIDYPTGGYERFEYQVIKSVGEVVDGVYEQANRGVQKKYVSVDGTTEIETTYEQFNNGTDYAIRTIAADQTKTERVLYRSNDSGFGFDDPRSGVPKEERAFDSSGKLASRTLTDLIVTPPQGSGAVSIATRDPRPATTVSITIENGKALASMSEISYETPGENGSSAPTDLRYFARSNVRQTLSYHFLPISNSVAESGTITDFKNLFHQSGHVSSISQSDYVYDENYMKRGISSLPSETRVLNPLNPNDVLSKTQTVFDDPAGFVADSPSLSGAVANSWINPTADPTIPVNSRNVRGKPTSMKLWLSEESRWLESKTQYDQYGNVRKAWDSSGDNARFTETEYSSLFSSAYPTKVITPAPNPDNTHGTNQTSVVETTYDFTTGLALSVKDDFGRVSTTEYDAALRPIRVNPIVVNGGPTGPKSEMVYGQPDSNGQFQPSERFVKTRKQLDANNWDEATTWFDALGRTIKTQAKDSQGDVFVETHYDDFGRVDRVTNPYRGGETVYWSKTRYDELGRAVEAFAPEPLSNLANAKSLGITSFDISTVPGNFGTVVETKDAANKRSRSITNALGQLIVVEEADSGGNLKPLPESTPLPVPSPTATPTPGPTPTPTPIPTPTPGGGGSGGGGGHGCVANCPQSLVPSDFPSYATYYTYNVQGKLVQVTQGDQNRYFKYDSLGRLIRVSQPEQQYNQNLDLSDYYNLSGHWTAGFTYDVLGNVISATDAKGTVITNTYDKANRVTARTYSNEPVGVTTPAVNFFYDGKGLDTMQSPNFAKGKLTKVENGVSQTRYTQFDNFGRLVSTEQRTPLDGQTIANATPYVSSYQYNLSGALVQETYPSGRIVKNEFESDGDLANVTSKAATSTIFRPYVSDFSYTAAGGITQMKLGNGRYETAKFNNRLQVTELGLGNSATDASLWKTNYDYGELDGSGNVDATKNTGNIAKQTLTVPGASFVQSYNYDSLYRLTQAKETSSSTQNWIQNWTYDRYGNRTNFTQNVAGLAGGTAPAVDPNTNRFTDTSFHYDKNGNVVQDVDPVSSHNRQFIFNGDNKQIQVKDLDSSGQSIGTYFYDGEGKRVKKVTDQETTVFVYSSGKLIAEYSTQVSSQPRTNYTTTDHLGSPRIITDELGQVTARRDFMPFGEDIFVNVGNRTTALKYGTNTDDLRQRFTGYQKDNETSLDFAEARMYENRFGRFTAVDPLLASGKSANPQTFNRYVYVSNSPIAGTDPTGMFADYYDRQGNYLATDAKGHDGKYYFATPAGKENGTVYAVKGSIEITTWEAIAGAKHRTDAWYSQLSPTSADGDAVRSMATQATNGVNDAVSGIPKGIGNFPAVTLNGLTDLAFNGRGGVYVPGPNPFAVPLPFSGGNAREESYISAGTTGFGLGLGPALGVFGGGSSLLSVVPEISSTEPLPTLLFDYNTHPDLAENIWHAQRAGHPETLTWQGPSRVNRTNALRDVPSGILTRDEYPFASTAEGGTGAWVGHVPGSQNFSQGRMIQNFVKANNMQPGNRFVVCVINYSGC